MLISRLITALNRQREREHKNIHLLALCLTWWCGITLMWSLAHIANKHFNNHLIYETCFSFRKSQGQKNIHVWTFYSGFIFTIVILLIYNTLIFQFYIWFVYDNSMHVYIMLHIYITFETLKFKSWNICNIQKTE